MIRRSVLDACETLERRAAARALAALAQAKRLELVSARVSASTRALKESMRSSMAWTAFFCATVQFRFDRADGERHRAEDIALSKREEASAHRSTQRRWAAKRRGLELRAQRSMPDATWQD